MIGFGNRGKRGSSGRRTTIWIPHDVLDWKRQTNLTWPQIMKAGIEALGTAKQDPYKAATPKELQKRLEFWVTKAREMQAEIEKMRARA